MTLNLSSCSIRGEWRSFANLMRRPQTIHRRRDRPAVGMRCQPDQLQTGNLVSHERSCAAADMTVHARYARMWRVLVANVLRLHDGMTSLAAKLSGIHDGNAMITAAARMLTFASVANAITQPSRATCGPEGGNCAINCRYPHTPGRKNHACWN